MERSCSNLQEILCVLIFTQDSNYIDLDINNPSLNLQNGIFSRKETTNEFLSEVKRKKILGVDKIQYCQPRHIFKKNSDRTHTKRQFAQQLFLKARKYTNEPSRLQQTPLVVFLFYRAAALSQKMQQTMLTDRKCCRNPVKR